jgi:hypothetical protein
MQLDIYVKKTKYGIPFQCVKLIRRVYPFSDVVDAVYFFDNIHLKSDYQHSAEFESAAKQNEREGSKGNRRFPLRLPKILCNVVRI